HRFPGANTALPIANEDAEQLKISEDFLKNKIVSVDIFALSPARSEAKPAVVNQSEIATTFAVGEEAEAKITPGAVGEAAPVTARFKWMLMEIRSTSATPGHRERLSMCI